MIFIQKREIFYLLNSRLKEQKSIFILKIELNYIGKDTQHKTGTEVTEQITKELNTILHHRLKEKQEKFRSNNIVTD